MADHNHINQNIEIKRSVREAIKQCIANDIGIPRYFTIKLHEEKKFVSAYCDSDTFVRNVFNQLSEIEDDKQVIEFIKALLDEIERSHSIVVLHQPCGCVDIKAMSKEHFEKFVELVKSE